MNKSKWISAWCSRIGSSHLEENIPCQDYSKVESIKETDFIVAAIADGAGSCEKSHIGSQYLVDNAIEHLKSVSMVHFDDIETFQTAWREEAFLIFSQLKLGLKLKAEELKIDFKLLSSTLIIAITNSKFVACANIGDGRAAFRDNDSNWYPMITPTKGEEANQTLFITSDLWDENIDSEYFGTFFYGEPITALALLTDGCERASFEILKHNDEENKYFDPNNPYKPFFEPNYINLIKLKKANVEQEKINDLWGMFIDKGNSKLINETDDKSMVLSVFVSDE